MNLLQSLFGPPLPSVNAAELNEKLKAPKRPFVVAVRLTGWSNESAYGRYPGEIFNIVRDSVCDVQTDTIDKVLTGKESTSGPVDFVISVQNTKQYCIELNATSIHDDEGNIAGIVLVFRDVTEIRALSRDLMYHATHDPLTGLYNRREFERHLQEALLEARTSGVEYALCYLDLDMFKVVNDTCGHVAGDELLKQISQMIRQQLRKEDILVQLQRWSLSRVSIHHPPQPHRLIFLSHSVKMSPVVVWLTSLLRPLVRSAARRSQVSLGAVQLARLRSIQAQEMVRSVWI